MLHSRLRRLTVTWRRATPPRQGLPTSERATGQVVAGIARDLKQAARILARTPAFAAVAILSFAIGIGAATSVFSVVSASMLDALPVPDPDALRVVRWQGSQQRIPSWEGGDTSFPPPFLEILRDRAANQAEVFGFVPLTNVILRADHDVFSTTGAMVSDHYFSGLQVRAALGRVLTPGADFAGTGTSVVISDECWARYFGRSPAALGRVLMINGLAFRIVGILPRTFHGTQPGQPMAFYVPMSDRSPFLYVPITSTFHWYVRIMARLSPGTDERQLHAALNTTFGAVGSEFMHAPRLVLEPGSAGISEHRAQYRQPLLLMLGLVGVIILVVCANLTGLSLARRATLQHELAVRRALGAGRWQLIRLQLTENLLLACLGGGLGFVLSWWGRAGVARLLAGRAQDLSFSYTLDSRVVAFTLGCTLLTALLSGLIPAIWGSGIDPVRALGSRGSSGPPRLRLGRVVVAAQMACALTLVAGGAMLSRTVANLVSIDPGFDVERLLLCHVNIRGSAAAHADPGRFYASAETTIRNIPGVQGASLIEFPLLGDGGSSGGFDRLVGSQATTTQSMSTSRLTVGESFFSTMGVPILRGRSFEPTDSETSPRVVVVNETFARKYAPGQDPIGMVFSMWAADWQIVGVSRDIKYGHIKAETPPTAYFPYRQRFYSRYRLTHLRAPWVAIRTTLPPTSLASAVRARIAGLDPDVALTEFTSQVDVRNESIARERLMAALSGGLALIALGLSCLGLYGLMSYQVSRRTGEFGIRLALGATPQNLAYPLVREAVLLAVGSVVLGLPVALALTRVARSYLYGVTTADPVSFAVAVVALVTVSGLAAWLPARRSARLDPMTALRQD